MAVFTSKYRNHGVLDLFKTIDGNAFVCRVSMIGHGKPDEGHPRILLVMRSYGLSPTVARHEQQRWPTSACPLMFLAPSLFWNQRIHHHPAQVKEQGGRWSYLDCWESQVAGENKQVSRELLVIKGGLLKHTQSKHIKYVVSSPTKPWFRLGVEYDVPFIVYGWFIMKYI